MLRQLGNLFERRSAPPRPAAPPPEPESERIHLGVWPPKRKRRQVMEFSRQFYASGMTQPPPIPKSLRRF